MGKIFLRGSDTLILFFTSTRLDNISPVQSVRSKYREVWKRPGGRGERGKYVMKKGYGMRY